MHPFKDSRSQETRTLSVLSGLFGIVSLFFIARHVPEIPAWIAELPRDFFLIALPSSAIALLAGIFYFNHPKNVRVWAEKVLFLFFPAILFFSIAWYFEDEIPDTAKVIVSFYILSVGVLFTGRTLRKHRELSNVEPSKDSIGIAEWIRLQGIARILFVLLLTGTFFGFAAKDLGKSANVDEALWLYGRIPKYWNALGSMEFQKTNISDKPGITVALASGAGLLREENPLAWKSLRGNDRGIDEFFFTFRIPIVALATLFLPLFYFILERIGGRTRALFAYTLIALAPATVGMTKIINPDAFLWVFTPLSLLSYLAYFRRRHIGYLILSGVLLGLALLTKYVANILFVFVLGVIFLEYALRNEEEPFFTYLKRSLLAYALWTFTALSVFFLLFPATWLKPEKVLEATIFSQAFESTAFLFLSLFAAILLDRFLNRSRLTETIMRVSRKHARFITVAIASIWASLLAFVSWNTLSGMRIHDYPALLSAPKTILENTGFFGVFSANLYPLIFGSHPITTILLFGAALLLIRKSSMKVSAEKVILYGIVFILLYYVGSAINGVGSITRYQIVLFPIAATIAGFVAGSAIKSVIREYGNRLGKASPFITPAFLILFTGSSILTLAKTPFPLSYASPFLPEAYHTDMKDMGPGSYEAAEYLNSLPNAMNLVVWSDKDGVCKFFVGRCKSGFSWDAYENLRFDYIVVSSARESRTDKRVGTAVEDLRKDVIRFDTYYNRTDGVAWELLINGRPSHYVKIYPFER